MTTQPKLSNDLAWQPDHGEETVEAVEKLASRDSDVSIHAGVLGMGDVNLVVHAGDRGSVAPLDVGEYRLRRLVEELDLGHGDVLPQQTARITQDKTSRGPACDPAMLAPGATREPTESIAQILSCRSATSRSFQPQSRVVSPISGAMPISKKISEKLPVTSFTLPANG